MKVIVNAVGYVGQSGGAGGAGVFLQYLVEQLARRHSVDVLIAQNARGFQAHRGRARFIELPYLNGETLQHLRSGPTVVLDPFGGLPCLPFPEDMALCAVVHDLMHLERPHFFTATERYGRSQGFASGLQRADGLVTFSADQARAIRRFYPGAKPIIIPHLPYATLEAEHSTGTDSGAGNYAPFLLFPAVKWPHKNHRTVLEAFGAYVKLTGSKLRLLLCGGPCAESRFSYYPDPALLCDQIVDLGQVSEKLLQDLLQNAEAVIFPTLYEGFGIPVLEAAFLGKMVIASKLDVFDEILGPEGYRPVDEPRCQMRWMIAFTEAESDLRRRYESVSGSLRKSVDPESFISRFVELLSAAAARYTHPSLYPHRVFPAADRPTSSVLKVLTFSDIHGTASAERGTQLPVIGTAPSARSSAIFRSVDAAPDRRVCLRANFEAPLQMAGAKTSLLFSAWLRLQGDTNAGSIVWSFNDADIIDVLPLIADGEWHLFRRAVKGPGEINFRATRATGSEVSGYDLEIHDACIVAVTPMAIPEAEPLACSLTIVINNASERLGLEALVGAVKDINVAIGAASHKLRWVLVTTPAVTGVSPVADLPANLRVQMVERESFDRATAARLISPYDPVDQLMLLEASDLAACLGSENIAVIASAIDPARPPGARRVLLGETSDSIWADEERGFLIDVRSRIGQPIPLLDRAALQSCRYRRPAARKPRFAVIETDLAGGISHHSLVTGLFLDGAEACGFDPVVGLNRAALNTYSGTVESWHGFGAQVYTPSGRADDFADELAAFVSAQKLGPGDLIFMHSLSPQILLGTARYVAGNPQNSPRFAMRFFSTAESMGDHRLSYIKILKSIFAMSTVRDRMHFFCESRNLIAYYLQATGQEFPLLLNPEHPALNLVRQSGWFDPGLGGREQKTLAYFGEARTEKGFDAIPGIIEALIEIPAMAEFRFMIQVGSNNRNQTPDMGRAKDALFALKARHPARIRTFESAENPEEFYFLMKHAVGVISPYRVDSYGKRGTGVNLEALQMGLDVFTWEETDLYATFRDTGHVIGVRKSEDFAAVIARYYKQGAPADRPGVAALRRTPGEVCRRLLSLCEKRPSGGAADRLPPILWVGNDTFGEGCSAVYASQKRALREIGRDVLELFVPWPNPNWRGADPGAYDEKLYGFDSPYESTGLGWVARPNYGPELDRILEMFTATGPTYARMRALNTHMIMPKTLKQALAANAVDQTLLNYSHLYPLVAETMKPDRIVCETHDVLSYQHAVRRGNQSSLTEKIDEFSDLAKFRQIVAISASEQREMASACPSSNVFWRLPPYIPEAPPSQGGYGGADAEQLAALIASTPEMAAIARPSPSMLAIYQSRGDLRRAYDLSGLLGRVAFFRWWVFYSRIDYAEQFRITPRQYHWLIGPAQEPDQPAVLGGLLLLMLSARADLRAAFVRSGSVNVAGLQNWASINAEREFGCSPASLQEKARLYVAPPAIDAASDAAPLDAVLSAQPAGLAKGGGDLYALLERISAIGSIDMVLVGSGHPANIISFEWFLNNVYRPHLAPLGHTLFIVGSAGDSLGQHRFRNMFLLGRCRLIEPLLRAARCCPLPVVAGSGSPIKTIPALAVNGAVTASDHVSRAFRLDAFGLPAFSDPKAFADDVRLLLTNTARRDERIRASQRYVDEMLTLSGYVDFWRERFDAPMAGWVGVAQK